jgi:hypothetical protein
LHCLATDDHDKIVGTAFDPTRERLIALAMIIAQALMPVKPAVVQLQLNRSCRCNSQRQRSLTRAAGGSLRFALHRMQERG